jgi:lysophospholipase L1-like esterase
MDGLPFWRLLIEAGIADSGAMKRLHSLFLSALLAMPLATGPAAAIAETANTSPSTKSAWQATWQSSPQPVWDERFLLPLGMPRELNGVTLRQAMRTSLGGERLRVVVSNEYGQAPLKIGRLGIRRERTRDLVAIRFQGAAEALVPAGGRLMSDPVSLATGAGDRLEIDLYLPQPTSLSGFHWDARERTLVLAGDAAGRPASADAQALTARAFVTELLVESAHALSAVVVIGDSITDGNGSTPGADQRWPDHLARRLAPRGVATLNAGISGNRLLLDGMGDSGLARFERDVLGHRGVRAVIVLLGTNDIGWPGSPFGPGEPPVSVQELTRGMRQLVEQGHARGVRVIGATLPPFEDALKGTPLEGHYSPQKEAQRQRLNDWIRGSGAFDAVVDFDLVLRDPRRPSRLRPDFDSGDHLHPGDAGYRAMAEAIDLDALLGDAATELR